MTSRERLPNRRKAETFELQAAELRYVCTIGRFVDGRVAEIFLSSDNAGSQARLRKGQRGDLLDRAPTWRSNRSACTRAHARLKRSTGDSARRGSCPHCRDRGGAPMNGASARRRPRRARVVPSDPNAGALMIEREITDDLN